MQLSELFKIIIIGIIEGVTEWLPISSTGHMILVNELISLEVSDAFLELLLVVIQLGAIAAVPTVFYKKLFPFGKSREERHSVHELWGKVLVGMIPAVVLGFIFEMTGIDRYLDNYVVAAVALIIYGIAFLILPRIINGRNNILIKKEMSAADAFGIGMYQTLSLIPGTSRSGATMLGGMLLGYDAASSAEFSFFMAIPVMLGASGLKIVSFLLSGASPTSHELVILLVGMIISYLVSIASIRFLLDFVKGHGVRAFGIYRIILGAVVIFIFIAKKYG